MTHIKLKLEEARIVINIGKQVKELESMLDCSVQTPETD